ncbi:U6 snRNA-associated Sm-like protein LSm2 [Gryllus bimaculatus]|nr:U6 snRNA-associated Sm-like protein LSm2 [Gryllus bimaculatus]
MRGGEMSGETRGGKERGAKRDQRRGMRGNVREEKREERKEKGGHEKRRETSGGVRARAGEVRTLAERAFLGASGGVCGPEGAELHVPRRARCPQAHLDARAGRAGEWASAGRRYVGAGAGDRAREAVSAELHEPGRGAPAGAGRARRNSVSAHGADVTTSVGRAPAAPRCCRRCPRRRTYSDRFYKQDTRILFFKCPWPSSGRVYLQPLAEAVVLAGVLEQRGGRGVEGQRVARRVEQEGVGVAPPRRAPLPPASSSSSARTPAAPRRRRERAAGAPGAARARATAWTARKGGARTGCRRRAVRRRGALAQAQRAEAEAEAEAEAAAEATAEASGRIERRDACERGEGARCGRCLPHGRRRRSPRDGAAAESAVLAPLAGWTAGVTSQARRRRAATAVATAVSATTPRSTCSGTANEDDWLYTHMRFSVAKEEYWENCPPPPIIINKRFGSEWNFWTNKHIVKIGKDVVVELKNDLSICGTLHSVDQYLNIKLTDISVTDPDKYPHMLSVKNCFIRGSVVRYVQLPGDEVDTQLLQDAARKEAAVQTHTADISDIENDMTTIGSQTQPIFQWIYVHIKSFVVDATSKFAVTILALAEKAICYWVSTECTKRKPLLFDVL